MSLKEMLGEELYKQVAEKVGDKKLIIDDGTFIPKSRFDEVNNQKKELKAEVDTLNNTLKSNATEFEKFKKSAEGNEELQRQLAEYQEMLNTTQSEFNSKLEDKEKEWGLREVNNRKSFTIREKLLTEHADPKYIDLMMNQIDLNNITVDEKGSFIGVDDVVSNVKTNFDKLFSKPQIIGNGIATGANPLQNKNLSQLQEKARSGKLEDRIAYIKAKQEIQE